jgi:hypothetical protein
MAKSEKKEQPAIKGSWADVIKASVKGNPKPKPKKKKDKNLSGFIASLFY